MANKNIYNPPETIEEAAKILADHMPIGRAWANKGIAGSNMHSLVRGLSHAFMAVQNKTYELSQEFYIKLSVDLLSDWETSVGLPNDCIFGEKELPERRENVLSRLISTPIVTNEDFVDLAFQLTGLVIEIDSGVSISPFTMYITFVSDLYGFPFEFPFEFIAEERFDIVKCVFAKIKPANVAIIYTQD